MKRHIMIFAAFAAVISCNNVDGILEPQSPEVSITAGHTKTVVGQDGITWDGTEEIAALFTNNEEGEFHTEKFTNTKEAGKTAKFVGRINSKVHTSKGWDDAVYCVYPSTSLSEEVGAIMHTLPVEQYAHAEADGSFASGLNLAYAKFPLSDLEKSLQGKVIFNNALTALRMTPGSGDIMSITVNGSAPLTGTAPMVFDNDGKLVLDVKAQWTGNSSVVLKPAKGKECFTEGVTYNILVYPGEHETFSVTLNYKDCGDYTRTLKTAPTLEPSQYYVIGFNSDSNEIILKLANSVTALEGLLPSLDQLEGNVQGLESQIQSVTLLSEYINNAAYAQYGQFNTGLQKLDLQLDYIVRPEYAAEALVEAFKTDPSIVSGLLRYTDTGGNKQYADLTVNDLIIKEATFGKYVTAMVGATNIPKQFYDGIYSASVALNVKANKTDVLSDFANLIPKAGSAIGGSYLKNIPAIPGATVVIPFNFAVANPAASYLLDVDVDKTENVDWATVNYDRTLKTGNLSVRISESASVESQNAVLSLVITDGDYQETISQEFTFVDSGARINFVNPGKVDYIGGEVTLEMDVQNVKNYLLTCTGAKQDGAVFSFDENSGNERTATVECEAELQGVSLKYRKSFTLTQSAVNTPLTRDYYVGDNNVKVLQSATNTSIRNSLNIVILGDGYKKKDLAAGGLFERRANSAMENFFGLEPFASYRNRFKVYMAGYESEDEGTDITSENLSLRTYFDSYWSGTSTAISLTNEGKQKVNSVVNNDLGLMDGNYYRTIVIMLVNTDADAGSTFYPYQSSGNLGGDGYDSFAVACVGANSTGFGGLIRHEAGGHAFGRLADEYITVENGTSLSAENKTNLSNAHSKGFYWNVTADYNNYSLWKTLTDAGYSSEEVGYYEGAWRGATGCWRSSLTSIMQSTRNTGNFNAISRYAIWRRIVLQSDGYENDTMTDFKAYDQKNR